MRSEDAAVHVGIGSLFVSKCRAFLGISLNLMTSMLSLLIGVIIAPALFLAVF